MSGLSTALLADQVRAIIGERRAMHLIDLPGGIELRHRRLMAAHSALTAIEERFGAQTAKQWFGGSSGALAGMAPGRALAEMPIERAEVAVAAAARRFLN